MRHFTPNFSLSTCAIGASLLLAACGGGGASAPAGVAGSSGFAVDGYLSGATVFCDGNNNGILDTGEASVVTDSSGYFKFPAGCSANLVATGGTNTDTKLPFVGTLKAPAGSTVVTPLTTLMVGGMTLDQINTAMGLPAGTDVRTLDPARSIDGNFVNGDLFKRTLAVQQLIQKTAESLAAIAGSGANAALPAIYQEVAAAMAASLRLNPALLSGTAVDQAALTALIQAAALRVGSSTVISSTITAGVASVDAASLAQVLAGALKAQGDKILQSTDAAITSTTSSVQGDSQIATFVAQNKGNLSTSTATLASTLLAQVAGGTPTPPTPPTGTSIVSFDETTPAYSGMGAYGGGQPSVAAGPAGGSGNALKIIKAANVLAYGGAYFSVAAIPFTADRQSISARVYSSVANAAISFKVQSSNGGPAIEVVGAATGAANTWQTVTWDMTGIDVTKAYDTIAITPDNGVTASGQTYYIDDITLTPAATTAPAPGNCTTSTTQCVSFSESTIAAVGFEGLISATVTNDPIAGASNKVLSLVKGPSGQLWAGATIYTMGTPTTDGTHAALTIAPVGLNTSKTVTLRSYTSAPVGTTVTLKLENGIDPSQNIAAETVTTQQNQWETLTFNFSNLTTGVFSSTTVYDTASIFPAFSINGSNTPLAADTTFYFDNLAYAVAGSSAGGGGGATAPLDAPTTTIPSGAVTVYSDALTTAGFDPHPNWGQTVTESEPTIASNKSLKYVFQAGGFGTTGAYEGLSWSPAVDVSAKSKLHIDFWSPDLTSVKISLITSGPSGGESAYTQAITNGSWNGVDINLSNFTAPNLASIDQIKLESAAGGTLYVDNIYFAGTASGGSGGASSTPITFSSGLAANNLTVEGGAFGGFSGSDLDSWNCGGNPSATSCGGGGTFVPAAAAADSYFYYYYQTTTPAAGLYAGIYVQAPGVTQGLSATADTAGVQIAGQTTMNFNFNPNPEWYQSATNNFMVQFDMGKLYTVSGNACHMQLRQVVTPTSAASAAYTLNLGSFAVVQNCGVTGATTASVLAGSPISQVSFQAAGGGSAVGDGTKTTGANLSVSNGTVYPTTLVIKGPITFQ